MDDIENSNNEHVPTTVDDMESSYDELRRSKRQRKKVSFGDDFYTYLIEKESSSYFEASSSSDALLWKEAIKTEFGSILKNQTWELVDLPSGAKPISYKWFFKRKYLSYGSIEKYKARLVAKVFHKNKMLTILIHLLLLLGFLLFVF